MKLLTLSAPSKTFLVGEYIALSGGPTLILNTQPRFELTANITNTDTPCKQQGIRIHSPAGKFVKISHESFMGYQLSFKDPHKGAGGFGASSAQFAMTLLLEQLAKNQKKINLSIPSILQFYNQCSWSGNGPLPSGADVIAQMLGGISFYYVNNQQLEKLSWPFNHINFCLIRTGQKIATHQHLSTLATNAINHSKLIDITLRTYQSIKINQPDEFITCIQQYAALLDKLELVAPHTQQLLQKIKQYPEVVAAKGCGAMGADVILIIFESMYREALLERLEQQSFNIVVFGHEQLSNGIECKEVSKIHLGF